MVEVADVAAWKTIQGTENPKGTGRPNKAERQQQFERHKKAEHESTTGVQADSVCT